MTNEKDLGAQIEEVEKLKVQIRDLSQQLNGLRDRFNELHKEPEKEIYMYFETRSEFVKAVHYLQDQKVQIELAGVGALIAPISSVELLRNQQIKFNTANTKEELNSIYTDERIESWREQIGEYYRSRR